MRDLYDRIIEEGEAGIQRLIDERTQEGLQLDFKQKARPENGAFDDGDRKILAKAISGFANSAGGLIVWGVNAEKVGGVDCAQAPAAPIAQIERFASEATSLVGQLIQPRHDGVHIAPIQSAAGDGSGFLLMYVERSERRPHRSEAKAQKQYYKRAGDSFFEMEHYDIEDAFSRVGAPAVDLTWTNRFRRHTDVFHQGAPLFGIVNNSDYIARNPYITISEVQGLNIYEDCLVGGGFRWVRDGVTSHFIGGSDAVIHPGMHIPVFELRINYNKKAGVWMMDWRNADEFVPHLKYIVGCDGGRSKMGELRFPAADFYLPG